MKFVVNFAKYYVLFLLSVSLMAEPIGISTKIKNSIACPENVKQALNKGEYKVAILELQKHIEQNPTAELYLHLANAFLQDQQQEEAFKSYIRCLQTAVLVQNKCMTQPEQAMYDELLALYFANSIDLEAKLTSVLKEHPDFYGCQFFLAAQCANAKAYEPFFYIFYQSFTHYPDCHMAHKTKGVVASLLLQRSKTIEEKEVWRTQALDELSCALRQCPKDLGLHRMLIYTASDKERKKIVAFVIAQVLEKDVKISRGEIPFLINHALWVDEIALAQDLLDKAKTWYEYSRILQEMQELIAQHKAK